MKKRLCVFLMSMMLLFAAAACSSGGEITPENATNRDIVLKNDQTSEDRNRLLTEDILYLKENLPKLHKNLFSVISQEEFNAAMDGLSARVDELNNAQVFTELDRIVASVGDAHTNINIRDDYGYPLDFWVFDGKICIVNADKSLEEMMFSQVVKIDGVDIDTVVQQLTTLISHENESWVSARLPDYLKAPIYLYGLGIVQDEKQAVFTVRKDGEEKEYTVSALSSGEEAEYVNPAEKDVLIGKYDTYYDYKYLPEQNALYFEYNVCANLKNRSFSDFNSEMFGAIEENSPEKIVVDLRSNSGGNSEVLNPFTQRLAGYIAEHPEVRVYTLISRNTFSSGMFAIYRIKEAAPDAVLVGEPTGGALDCYGEVRGTDLPNSQLPVSYSTKYFEFSKDFTYHNGGIGTCLPDVSIRTTIEDYESGRDPALAYVLAD